MENNVGKIILYGLIGMCIAMNIHAYIDLSIDSIDGGTLHQAEVGRPFVVTVTISGYPDSEPKIQGIEQFQIASKSKRVTTINNHTSVSYSYQVYSKSPGSYTIGPATVEIAGTSKQSNSRVVTVSQQEKTDKKLQQEAATLQLSVDKSHVVVGEKIRCILKFCCESNRIHLEQIQKPHFDASVDFQDGPAIRNEQQNGNSLMVAEWTFEIRPDKPGKLVIPASSADITVQKEANDQLSAFSLFFMVRSAHRKIYSNAVTIDVDELPVAKESIRAVGTFTRFDATLKPAVAKEGEGMVLTLELEGDAPLNALQTPQLQKMPPSLKWYESKHYVREAPAGKTGKIVFFEYVVQGLQQGKWEIPAQRFTYFDVKERSVKTIKSSALKVLIQPGNLALAVPNSPEQTEQQTAVANVSDEISPIITTAAWPSTTGTVIPWSLFFIIVIIPLLWALSQGVKLYAAQRAPYFMRLHAFKYARKQLKKAEHTDAVSQLLGIFSQAIALRLKVPVSLISQDLITQKLQETGMSPEKIEAFNKFCNVLHELAFCKGQMVRNSEFLFKQARVWLDELEAVL